MGLLHFALDGNIEIRLGVFHSVLIQLNSMWLSLNSNTTWLSILIWTFINQENGDSRSNDTLLIVLPVVLIHLAFVFVVFIIVVLSIWVLIKAWRTNALRWRKWRSQNLAVNVLYWYYSLILFFVLLNFKVDIKKMMAILILTKIK